MFPDRAERRYATAARLAGAHAFRVVGSDALVEVAESAFAALSSPGDLPVHEYLVEETECGHAVAGLTPAGQPESIADCLETLQWLLNGEVVAGLTKHQTGLHAACAQRGRQLLLMPASSGSGKSTLVAGLVREGWAYVTDEAAVLEDDTLTIRPYAKPITLDHGAWPAFPETDTMLRSESVCLVPVAALGGSTGPGGSVTAVVSPDFRPGSPTVLKPLTPAELVMTLAGSTFRFSDDGRRHLSVLARLARTVPGYRLVTGDVRGAVDAVDALSEGLP